MPRWNERLIPFLQDEGDAMVPEVLHAVFLKENAVSIPRLGLWGLLRSVQVFLSIGKI